MEHVLGRTGDGGPAARLGRFRARDGSVGATVGLDLDRPHVGLVVGKRGSGKSYTLGVVAEGLAAADGVGAVVVDPMGEFPSLAAAGGVEVVDRPRVAASALPPRAWCALLGVAPDSAVGSLLWRVADDAEDLSGMRAAIPEADAARETRRAAGNHLSLAASWEVFDDGGLGTDGFADDRVTVLDLSRLAEAPMNAVVRGVAHALYDASDGTDPLQWLLVDEAHAFVDGVAWPALRRTLTRGRSPGLSTVLATQRPSALPGVAASQSDLVFAHRLTAASDVAALADVRPTYLRGEFADRLPTERGEALVVDDRRERIQTIRVRERRTPHGGGSPRASGPSRKR